MPTLLPNVHVSPETAYVVSDYPYGFRLRCQIRYWLDVSPKHGVRMMTQTSNPKKPGLVWNKPKATTYCRFAGAMFLDGAGHVQWTGLHEYMETPATEAWITQYAPAVPEASRATMEKWLRLKLAYEARKLTMTATVSP